MYYYIMQNHLFDDYRNTGLTLPEGYVEGVEEAPGSPNWLFDLPDEDSLYPGDVVHYRFEAEEWVDASPYLAMLPADTTGFADFSFESPYPVAYEMRALPTVNSPSPGDHPLFLVVNDNPGRGADNEWDFALGGYGYVEGRDFDLYRVKEPASGLGNGIGGRATPMRSRRCTLPGQQSRRW